MKFARNFDLYQHFAVVHSSLVYSLPLLCCTVLWFTVFPCYGVQFSRLQFSLVMMYSSLDYSFPLLWCTVF